MLDRNFWNHRPVLITGHTGFKGSWLSLWLHTLRAKVTGYALDPPTQPNLFEQAGIATTLHSIRGDVRDFTTLKRVVAECRPDVIIHMAAQSVVRRGYEDPIETYSSNVMGIVHLLEAVRQLKHRCVLVNVTSDKCYANREWVWGYRENEPMGGADPYSNSKGCAELVTTAYRKSFFSPERIEEHGVALASARAGNAIGGGDWTRDQLIPDLMRAFLASKPCLIRNGSAMRPWQFVLEPLRGYLMLAEKLSQDSSRFASSWNFGPFDADAKTVSGIADELVVLWGHGAAWIQDPGMHPSEARILKLDSSKANACLGWHPALPLRTALGWIVEWYRAFEAGKDLQLLSRTQIERYEALTEKQQEYSDCKQTLTDTNVTTTVTDLDRMPTYTNMHRK
jgi:CDP-glucose 4,6-dehydratase